MRKKSFLTGFCCLVLGVDTGHELVGKTGSPVLEVQQHGEQGSDGGTLLAPVNGDLHPVHGKFSMLV